MAYDIAVVTKVPDSETEDGNLAAPVVYRLDQQMTMQVIIHGRSPVFELGEILILDESGREFSGGGRKPSKWDVEIVYFDTIEDAVERVEAIAAHLTVEEAEEA